MGKVDSMISDATPLVFHLSQNYPDPFIEKTRITYCVAVKTRVLLRVLNSAGEVIDTLVDEEKNPGTYAIDFAASVGTTGEVRDLAVGQYSVRLEAGEYSSKKTMKLLK